MKHFFIALLITSPLFAKSIIPSEFTAEFEEKITSSVTGKVIKSNGTIAYKFPSQLRLEVLEPEASTVVVGPKKTWIYQPPFIEGEKGQVTIEKKSSWPLLKTFDSLTKSLEGSKEFDHKFQGKKLTITFKEATSKRMGIKEVSFVSNTDAANAKSFSEFESMSLTKNDGKIQSYKFTAIKIAPVEAKKFEFEIPKNTKTVEN